MSIPSSLYDADADDREEEWDWDWDWDWGGVFGAYCSTAIAGQRR